MCSYRSELEDVYLQIKMNQSNRDDLSFILDCWVMVVSNTDITIPAIRRIIAGAIFVCE
jgi:hypothetical protein